MSELKKLDLAKELINVPMLVSDANPETFWRSVNEIRGNKKMYTIIEEHIGVNMIVVNISGNGQAQIQAVHYCSFVVTMTKEDYAIFQAREKLKM